MSYTTTYPNATVPKNPFNTIRSIILAFTAEKTSSGPAVHVRPSQKAIRRKMQKHAPKILLAGIVLIVVGATISMLGNGSVDTEVLGDEDNRIQVEDARATVLIGKELVLPLRDEEDEVITEIKFVIDEAELRDELIVQGKRATAIEGRTFLVLNLKIINNFEQAITINTRDYVRLLLNGNYEERLAADIHNDPVAVQPLSTKLTRLGFPIDDTDSDIRLLVGELESTEKEELPLQFTFETSGE